MSWSVYVRVERDIQGERENKYKEANANGCRGTFTTFAGQDAAHITGATWVLPTVQKSQVVWRTFLLNHDQLYASSRTHFYIYAGAIHVVGEEFVSLFEVDNIFPYTAVRHSLRHTCLSSFLYLLLLIAIESLIP